MRIIPEELFPELEGSLMGGGRCFTPFPKTEDWTDTVSGCWGVTLNTTVNIKASIIIFPTWKQVTTVKYSVWELSQFPMTSTNCNIHDDVIWDPGKSKSERKPVTPVYLPLTGITTCTYHWVLLKLSTIKLNY